MKLICLLAAASLVGCARGTPSDDLAEPRDSVRVPDRVAPAPYDDREFSPYRYPDDDAGGYGGTDTEDFIETGGIP